MRKEVLCPNVHWCTFYFYNSNEGFWWCHPFLHFILWPICTWRHFPAALGGKMLKQSNKFWLRQCFTLFMVVPSDPVEKPTRVFCQVPNSVVRKGEKCKKQSEKDNTRVCSSHFVKLSLYNFVYVILPIISGNKLFM